MDFILELLGELFIEGGTSKRVPRWIRWLILSILAFFYLFLILGLFTMGISMFSKDMVVPGIMFLGIDIIVILGVVKYIHQLRKR